MPNSIGLLDQPNLCNFCGKKFRQAQTLTNHMCEQKRRHMQKDEKRVQTGFYVYTRFNTLTAPGRATKSYEDFCRTQFYNAFVKFGSYLNNFKPLYPDKFIDYLIKTSVKIDNWCSDSVYEKYLIDILKTEPVESALERSLTTMIEWAERENLNFSEYFQKVNLNRAFHDLKNGKISCWLLLSCSSGRDLLNRFSDDQLGLLESIIDAKFWVKRIKQSPADVAIVKELCKETGII